MTPELELPVNLADAAAQDLHERRRDWVTRLPGIVADLADRWDLSVGAPFQPGGQTAWVAPARDAAGRDLVLKAGWTSEESRHEAAGLRLWAGRGTVLVHADHVDGDTSALLLERARPGAELGRSLPEEEQDVVVAGLLRRLWVQPPAGHEFRPLAQMCEQWAQEHEEDTAAQPSTLAWPGPVSSCGAACRAPPSTRSCCSPTCTRATCCRPGGSRGW